jgi:hypothetical protein
VASSFRAAAITAMVSALVVATVAPVEGCDQVKQVTVTQTIMFDTQVGGPSGFSCAGGNGKPLADRATKGQFSIVADLIAVGGGGGLECRTASIQSWCASNPCPFVPASRTCIPVTIEAGARNEDGGVVQAVVAALGRTVIAQSAPDNYILVRVVATTQPCTELADATGVFDCGGLIGCATSCPFNPTGPSGDQELQLDYTSPAECEQAVYACASPSVVGPTVCGADASAD